MQPKDDYIYRVLSSLYTAILHRGGSALSQLYCSLQLGLNQQTVKKIAASGEVNKCIGPGAELISGTSGLHVIFPEDVLLR